MFPTSNKHLCRLLLSSSRRPTSSISVGCSRNKADSNSRPVEKYGGLDLIPYWNRKGWKPHKPPKLPNWEHLYEPKFPVPEVPPSYKQLNFRLQGYDYAVLERYQKFVHKTAKLFHVDVSDSWGTAPKVNRVLYYKLHSDTVDREYVMRKYERTTQLAEISATKTQLLIDFLQTHVPIGVELTVKVNDLEDDDARYIPDTELRKLQDELASLDDINVRRSLGWVTE